MGVKSVLTNCILVEKANEKYLFGEVVEDVRFSKGHHIRTTPLVSWDKDTKKGVTSSGTEYSVNNLYIGVDELRLHLKKVSTSDEHVDNLLFWALKD